MSEEDKKEKPKLPSFATMATNFAKDVVTYVKQGAPNVSEKNYQKRLDTCKACEHLIRSAMRCGKCGCLLEHKAKWKTTSCPIGKWEPEVLSTEQSKKIQIMKERQLKAQRDAANQKNNSKTSDQA